MKLLLMSNSTNYGEEFLAYATPHIQKFLGNEIKSVLFFPYASVKVSYDEYAERVKEKFAKIGVEVESIHQSSDPRKSIEEAEAFVVGGGNTFQLLKIFQKYMLMEELRYRITRRGIPYIGWSAGANIACPTISTTNDMPIVEPDSYTAINLVSFQINPHYIEWSPEKFSGESRIKRIEEFLYTDPQSYVVGLREGSVLWVEDFEVYLLGDKPAKIFKEGEEPKEYHPGDDLDFLY